jgi:hypothetical protein
MSRLLKALPFVLVAAVIAFAVLAYVHTRFALPADKPEIDHLGANKEPELPPGEPAVTEFPAPKMSSAERQAFLTADYKIIEKVADLPSGIRKLYTVKGGSRIAIADPGERFEATDVITDLNLPRRRLMFAGVAHDRAFMHYEVGGIAHSYKVELFRLESPDTAVALWSGYCGPAKNLEDIKQLMLEEDRNSSQAGPQLRPGSEVQWQDVDQLCGSLTLRTPKKKTITTADGKTETRLYSNALEDAGVALFRGTSTDENCCGGKTPAEHAKSTKYGRFELPGFQSGWYWLRVERDNFSTTIPLHVTRDFNYKSCHDPSVGRIFIVDAQPPKIETLIY